MLGGEKFNEKDFSQEFVSEVGASKSKLNKLMKEIEDSAVLGDEDVRVYVGNKGGSKIETKKESNKLTKEAGVFNGPSGRETYYDLDMQGIVKNMRRLGYSKEEYPFKIREDGVKMLGDYVMIAANRRIKGREQGKILNTSLGKGIVCDTGSFVKKHPTGIDIATDWKHRKYERGTVVDI